MEVDLQAEENYVDLEISDNGCGFDLNEKRGPRSDGGLGLLHMRERASLVGGIFSLTSTPGAGVRMMIHVPIPREETVLN